ncbi:glycosyltransferase [Ahrensia marina]|uniref:glycosyltransferase family 2 protein n=1 Tax=Ahrensia marina TaxID=1514904 RepID=UPI0035CF0E27
MVEGSEIDGQPTFTVFDSLGAFASGLGEADVPLQCVAALTRIATAGETKELAIHADTLVRNERALLVADIGKPGRAIATAWLAGQAFDYVGSDWTLHATDTNCLQTQQGAIVLDSWASKNISRFPLLTTRPLYGPAGQRLVQIDTKAPPPNLSPALLVFPSFEDGADCRAAVIDPDEAALLLSSCLLNAAQLDGGGFDMAKTMAADVPAVSLKFGAPDQLDRAIDLIDALLDSGLPAAKLSSLVNAVSAVGGGPAKAVSIAPKPTPPRGNKRLTIGMATFDDYDGVYFTLQSLRLHHPEIMDQSELLVIDNNPTGPCAEALKAFENRIANYRYVPFAATTGPSASKAKIFDEATGDFVLVVDCHVLLAPGALARLDRYFQDNPDTNDLLQGPMVRDDLSSVYTHWAPSWRRGIFGTWVEDDRGKDPDAEPFDIPMQGAGLFACRAEAWPGFNPLFRGFGGEEGYLHEKFRQNGGRALCLPFLRWVHRFRRPMGIPYPLVWEDRIRNYLIGHKELGLPIDSIIVHFNDIIGEQAVQDVVRRVDKELAVGTSDEATVRE